MNMNNRTPDVDRRWQDSFNLNRRMIGFGCSTTVNPRPPTNPLSAIVKLVGVGCLIGLGMIATPSHSWAQEQHEKEKTTKTEKTTHKSSGMKSNEQEKQNKQEERNTRNNEGNREREGGREEHGGFQRGGGLRYAGEGRRLDEREFRGHFGYGHRFRPGWIGAGYEEFGYGGFTFGFLEPWPIGWAYTDDVYVMDVDGGYVLCNPLYPGITVGVIIE